MPGANGRGPGRAILYARVSTDEQARSGYSLAQQMEALRGYAARSRTRFKTGSALACGSSLSTSVRLRLLPLPDTRCPVPPVQRRLLVRG